jgi:uncharacterized protein (DUF885 family)
MSPPPHTEHGVHALSDRFVDEYTAAVPMAATYAGVRGHDHRWGDLSPSGVQERAQLLADTLARLRALPDPEDHWDRVAVRVLDEHLEIELADHEHGEPHLDLAHLGSTVPDMRAVLEAQATGTDEEREAWILRLEGYRQALRGWRETVDLGRRRGSVVAGRQVDSVTGQLRRAVDDRGSLTEHTRALARAHPPLATRLDRALAEARVASEETATWLEQHYRPNASERDGVGPDRYHRHARRALRTDLDPHEASGWAWERIGELWRRAERTARLLDPDAALPAVMHRLKTDPAFSAPSPAAFRDLMQDRQDRALAVLDGRHFRVPEPIRTVDVNLVAPGAPLGAWYIGPSEDLRRRGSIWWSLGDRQQVPLYEEVSTAYHEGFPGHHLQVGIQTTLTQHLSRAHRLLVWNPGYGEGWALYAERLMDELDELERPEYVLGYLTSALLRAVRVVVDLGLHLDLPIPADAPLPLHVDLPAGGSWDFEAAVTALEGLCFLDPDYARSEVTRYLGLPAQAISYALGERRIVELREARRAREGASFDLARFHADVLGSGPVGLDHLAELVLPAGHPAPAGPRAVPAAPRPDGAVTRAARRSGG